MKKLNVLLFTFYIFIVVTTPAAADYSENIPNKITLSGKPIYKVGEVLNFTVHNAGSGYLYLPLSGYHSIYNFEKKEYLIQPPYSRTAGYRKLGPTSFAHVMHRFATDYIDEEGLYGIYIEGYYSDEDLSSDIWINNERVTKVRASSYIIVLDEYTFDTYTIVAIEDLNQSPQLFKDKNVFIFGKFILNASLNGKIGVWIESFCSEEKIFVFTNYLYFGVIEGDPAFTYGTVVVEENIYIKPDKTNIIRVGPPVE